MKSAPVAIIAAAIGVLIGMIWADRTTSYSCLTVGSALFLAGDPIKCSRL